MKTSATILLLLCASFALAQQGSTINFNLVQVNHYSGQEKLTDSVATPGQRMVIDIMNPKALAKFVSESSTPQISWAPVMVNIASIGNSAAGLPLPWESQTILRSSSGSDSFRVSSSRAGCPGTEIKPSVSVSFSMGRSWSDPPIRFGPLASSSLCPLGKGMQLEVSLNDAGVPCVRLREEAMQLGKR